MFQQSLSSSTADVVAEFGEWDGRGFTTNATDVLTTDFFLDKFITIFVLTFEHSFINFLGKGEKMVRNVRITFFRSFIEPRPRTAILHIVSSCKRFIEFPLGPSSLPTKLN